MKAIKIFLGFLMLIVVLMFVFVVLPDQGSPPSKTAIARTATPQAVQVSLANIDSYIGKRVTVVGYFSSPLTSIACFEMDSDPTKKFRCGIYLDAAKNAATSTWIFIENATAPRSNSLVLPASGAPLADFRLYDKSLSRIPYNSYLRVSGYVFVPNSRLAAGKTCIAADEIEVAGPPPK